MRRFIKIHGLNCRSAAAEAKFAFYFPKSVLLVLLFFYAGAGAQTSGGARSGLEIRETLKSKVQVWDTETGKPLYELSVPPRKTANGKDIDVSKARIYDLKFTADRRFLLGRTIDRHYPNITDGNLIAWNAENGEVVWQTPDVSPHIERYLGFKFSDDCKILVAVKEVTLSIFKRKEEVTAEIREAETGKLLKTLKNPETKKRKIAFYGGSETDGNLVFSPSAKTLITAGTSRAEVWNLETGERRCTFERAWEPATSLFGGGHTDSFRFRENEKIIAAGNDKYLRLWNAETCGLMQKIETPLEFILNSDDRRFDSTGRQR